ncbi:tectonic-2 isoform X1 [Phyllobates terribilis]|uniref:tectonic-2 isoform X1 n=2 Tax=Phyllobates terribilis TaxID=111132 RepID=UPI003CCAF8F0
MLPMEASHLVTLAVVGLLAQARAQAVIGFYPSTVFLSGPQMTTFLVANVSSDQLSLAVIADTTSIPSPSCNGEATTENWSSSLESFAAGAQLVVTKVLVTSMKNLTLCSGSEANCCPEVQCVVETLQVTACENGRPIASMLIHAEIFTNTTFVGAVSENKTVIPNQAYQPLGPCPCNLTAGACDARCCCDQECSVSMKELFNGSCYSGVFGGNVSPPFDQLCSVQEKNYAPDWFPFLCVQSPTDNSPFLGYFYQGYTGSPSQTPSFTLNFQSIYEKVLNGYKQGDAILIDQSGFSEYLTIPQQSSIGTCMSYAPVAYLQDFSTTCVTDIAVCTDAWTFQLDDLNVKDGNGGTIPLNIQLKSITLDIVSTGPTLPEVLLCEVNVSADYTFVWEANKIKEIQVTIETANITLTHRAKLSQRFTATFLTSNSTTDVLSGNPGYQIGKPVIAANGSVPFTKTTLSGWKSVLDSSCSSVTHTPILFGENSFSGCLLHVVNENCAKLRENVLSWFNESLLSVNHVSMRGNSNVSDPSEWISIIYEEYNTTCTENCGSENAMCIRVPSNIKIEILTAVTGAVEGMPQEEILAAKFSFSAVNINCVSACNLSLPLTASVQFIRVPAQVPLSVTRFQMTDTEYDCEKNDVCWQQLAYPLTKYYTGEPQHVTLAKGLILVFFFISAAVLGTPWNMIRKAWNETTF